MIAASGGLAMANRIVRVECAGLSEKDEQALLQDLRRLFPEAESSSVLQLSEAPPSWVQILADATTWTTVFKIAAAAYLAQLGKNLGDATWEARKKVRPLAIKASGAAIAALQRLYSILRSQKDRIGRRFSVSAALPGYGQWDVGTRLSLDDADEFVEEMALYVSRVDGITHAVRLMDEAGCVPILGIGCHITEKGFRLTWVERSENIPYEWDFDEDGTPVETRRRRPR